MDGGELPRASSSLRRNSTSSAIWRTRSANIFLQSSRGEDDEEDLKWASLEKLPTFDRLRKGLLKDTHELVDVENLGFQERKNLIERLVRIADEDNEQFLLKLKGRLDR